MSNLGFIFRRITLFLAKLNWKLYCLDFSTHKLIGMSDTKICSFDQEVESKIDEAYSFRPKPYIFRSNSTCGVHEQIGPDECVEKRVRFPDFNLMLDHSLAVIWICQHPSFCSETNLSEEQLQWAIRFMLSVRSAGGEHEPPEVLEIVERMQKLALKKSSTNRKHPKFSQSAPSFKQPSVDQKSVSFHGAVSQLCAEKVKDFVQLLGVGDGAESTSFA